MGRVVVVGGGWAGAAAALAAVKTGAEVELLEKTDCLLGTGLVGGIMRNNGRFTAAEEATALGGGELFEICDRLSRHTGVDFPGHRHASLYDVAAIEPEVRKSLIGAGVRVRLTARATGVVSHGRRIAAVSAVSLNGEALAVEGDTFVEATGTAGPQGNCGRYGNGCAMCVLRCPTFGPRVSVASKMGVKEYAALTDAAGAETGRVGAMSGSCKLLKESLAPEIVRELDQKGVCLVPVPVKLQKNESLGIKCCQQYALPEFAEYLVLLDTGHAKLMTPFFPLEALRMISGFEKARFEDPYSGGIGNSIRFLVMSPRDNRLKVDGVDNLFCAGEKVGPMVGHTEAIVTGTLAGHNAARLAFGAELLELPRTLAVGEAIAFVREQTGKPEGLMKKYTFSGSVLFTRMLELGLYSNDPKAIRERVASAGLTGVFAQGWT